MTKSISKMYLNMLMKSLRQSIEMINDKCYTDAIEKLMTLNLQIDVLISRLETILKFKRMEK